MKFFLLVMATCLLTATASTTWSEVYAADCYDRLLLSTMQKSTDYPEGRITSVDESFTFRSLSLFIDTDESVMIVVSSSKGVRQILEEQVKPDYRISPIVVSEELVSGHNRTSPRSYPEEFQVLTLNTREQIVVKTVVQGGETFTKHYDCKIL